MPHRGGRQAFLDKEQSRESRVFGYARFGQVLFALPRQRVNQGDPVLVAKGVQLADHVAGHVDDAFAGEGGVVPAVQGAPELPETAAPPPWGRAVPAPASGTASVYAIVFTFSTTKRNIRKESEFRWLGIAK